MQQKQQQQRYLGFKLTKNAETERADNVRRRPRGKHRNCRVVVGALATELGSKEATTAAAATAAVVVVMGHSLALKQQLSFKSTKL